MHRAHEFAGDRAPELAGDRALELARALEDRGARGARVAVVTGSGIGGIASLLEDPASIPFGDLGGARVLVQEGRVHLYEGRSAEEVARSVRAFARIGCASVVLTNAAGALKQERIPPVLMRIEDHVNLQGASAIGWSEAGTVNP